MTFTSALRRSAAGVLASAVAVGGLAALTSVPSSAATRYTTQSATMNYTCPTPVGNVTFTARVETDLPATVVPGTPVTPRYRATVVVPQNLIEVLYDYGYRDVDGSASLALTANGVASVLESDVAARDIVDAKPLPIVLEHTGSPFVAGAAGSAIKVAAGKLVATLNIWKGTDGEGNRVEPSTLAATCTPAAGVSTLVAAVKVQDRSTVSVRPIKAVKRGDVATVRVSVSARSMPAGSVTVKIGGATKKATLKGGRATVKVKIAKAMKPGRKTVTVTYLGSTSVTAKSVSAKVKVKR